MNDLDLLVKVREWYKDRRHWVRGTVAEWWQDPVDPYNLVPRACAQGAIMFHGGFGRLADRLGSRPLEGPGEDVGAVFEAIRALEGEAGKMGYSSVFALNDMGGYEAVLIALNRAIGRRIGEIYGTLEKPSVPIQVPAPDQPQRIPVPPPSIPRVEPDPEPAETPDPARTPEEEPVPA